MRRWLLAGLLLGFACGAQGFLGGNGLPPWWYQRTGLPPEVVAVLPIEDPVRVLFVFVYLDDRALRSNLRPERMRVVEEYQGKNALLAWAYSQFPVRFEPDAFRFFQGGREIPVVKRINVDGDFLGGRIVPGQPAAAVYLLGEGFDPEEPLTITYGPGLKATMALVPSQEDASAP